MGKKEILNREQVKVFIISELEKFEYFELHSSEIAEKLVDPIMDEIKKLLKEESK